MLWQGIAEQQVKFPERHWNPCQGVVGAVMVVGDQVVNRVVGEEVQVDPVLLLR